MLVLSAGGEDAKVGSHDGGYLLRETTWSEPEDSRDFGIVTLE